MFSSKRFVGAGVLGSSHRLFYPHPPLNMSRGNRALVSIVSEDLTVSNRVKGESTNDRDEAMACRFFYHGYLIGKRYDVCLATLSKEFFLSQTVIGQRLMKQQGFLKQLRFNNTTAKDLQTLYPSYNWHV